MVTLPVHLIVNGIISKKKSRTFFIIIFKAWDFSQLIERVLAGVVSVSLVRENLREFRENNKHIIRTTDKCRNPDSPNLICSGHGTCECDKCKCNEDDDGQYTGMPRIIQFSKLLFWSTFAPAEQSVGSRDLSEEKDSYLTLSKFAKWQLFSIENDNFLHWTIA